MLRRFSLLLVLATVGLMAIPSAAAGGSCHADSALKMFGTQGTSARIAECAFLPSVLYVEAGDRVTWSNKDVFPHTVTGVLDSWGSDKYLGQGDKISYAFKQEGVFPFYCELHPGMVGAVVVGDGAIAAGGFTVPGGGADVDAVQPDAARPASDVETTGSPARVVIAAIASLLLVGLVGAIFLRRRAATPAAPAA